MQQASDRALFANQLRGLAIVAVIIVHWCGIYWFARDTVASYIHAPVVEGPSSSMIYFLTIPTFNYGPFGVSVFFLISGFVIPFSLNRLAPKQFLVARFLRIYPTYIVGSLVMLALVYLSSRYWGQAFSMPMDRLLANLMLIQGNVAQPTIDLVNWTLSVEIKFYIIAALMYGAIKTGNAYPIFLFAAAVLGISETSATVASITHLSQGLIESLKTELMCVIFMFIGTGFYHHYTGTYSTRQLASYTAILMILFLLCGPHTGWREQIPTVPQNYLYGFIVFTVSYLLRGYFRPFAPLDFIANISYSIYVLHSIIGYASIRFLMDQGLSFPVSGLLTLIFVLALSYALHRLVEVPTMHLGKRLFHKKPAQATSQSAADVEIAK
ncbi:acyltransferase family protein [Pseudomonas putida]|uniref:Acyltransferase n=1 Tax=Pseudomonas putida TaxID=303 RepID=A0A6I6XDX1_PSEPU|nr:acyltransferase [Pseudomonas putida]QHG63832.1 acyltransferase [Pseudomonas putida]